MDELLSAMEHKDSKRRREAMVALIHSIFEESHEHEM